MGYPNFIQHTLATGNRVVVALQLLVLGLERLTLCLVEHRIFDSASNDLGNERSRSHSQSRAYLSTGCRRLRHKERVVNHRAPSVQSDDSAKTAAGELPAAPVEEDEEDEEGDANTVDKHTHNTTLDDGSCVLKITYGATGTCFRPSVEDEEDDDDANTAAEPEAPEGAAADDEEEAYIPRAQPRQPVEPNRYPVINRRLPQVFNRNDPWQDSYFHSIAHLRRAALQIDNLDYVHDLRQKTKA